MTASKYMLQTSTEFICKEKVGSKNDPYCNTGRPKAASANILIRIRPDEIKLSFHRSQMILHDLDPYDFAFHLFRRICSVLASGTTFNSPHQLDCGRNGFDSRVTLRKNGKTELATFEWGGGVQQRGWCLLHIHGNLCRLLKPSHYRGLYAMAVRLQARLGAIDIAGDDQQGLLGIHPSQVRRAHDRNDRAFMPGHLSKGQAPRFYKWYEGQDKSCTLYLGGQRSVSGIASMKRASNSMITCICSGIAGKSCFVEQTRPAWS